MYTFEQHHHLWLSLSISPFLLLLLPFLWLVLSGVWEEEEEKASFVWLGGDEGRKECYRRKEWM